jgi:hypothetical protein
MAGSFWANEITASGIIAGSLSSAIDANNVGIYNVVYYGADPTGGSSSVAAIQDANNAAAASTAGTGIVYFPAGSYLITADVNPSSGTFWLGPDATLSSDVGSGHNLLSNGSALSNLTISGLTLDLKDNGASAINFPAAGSTDITIENVTIKNGNSIDVAAVNIGEGSDSSFTSGHCERIRITNCAFVSVACEVTKDIIDLSSCDDSIISGCSFVGCTCNYCIGLIIYCNGVIVADCVFDGNSSELLIFGGQNMSMTGCYVSGTADHVGSQISNADTVNITGNTFTGISNSTAWIQFDVNTNIYGLPVQFSNSNVISLQGNLFVAYSKGIYVASETGSGYNTSPTNVIVRSNVFNGITTPIDYQNATSGSLVFEGNRSFNPVGYIASQTLSGTVTNPYPFTVQATVSGGSGVTNITLSMNGTSHATGLTSGTFILPVGAQISASYTTAPTVYWFGL